MKKQITGSCVLSVKIFQRWADFHLWRGRYPRLKRATVFFGIFALSVFMFAFGMTNGINLLTVAGVALLLCTFVFGYTVKTAIKKNLAAAKSLICDPYTFTLAPKGLVVQIAHKDGDERHDYFYDELLKVYDYNGCLYAYPDKDRCFIIPLGCLDAKPEQTRAFVADKLGAKYIKVTKY